MDVTLIAQKEQKKLGLTSYIEYLSTELEKQGVNTQKIIVDAPYPHQKILKSMRFSASGITHFTNQGLCYLNIFNKAEKTVTTIHDIFCITEKRSVVDRLFSSLSMQKAIKSDFIITNSRYVKDDIKAHYGRTKNIEAIHLGVDNKIFKKDPKARMYIREKYSGKEIILYVGSEEPRKNLGVLIEALGMINERNFVFIKVGPASWKNARQDTIQKAKDHGILCKTVFLDYVKDNTLAKLYNAADVFVFPSRAEGFGRPPLEAMACGCPLVTTNATSIPEIVGNVGILSKPDDPISFAKSIEKVLENRKLRRKMSSAGIKRSKKFSWKNTAKRTKDVYEALS